MIKVDFMIYMQLNHSIALRLKMAQYVMCNNAKNNLLPYADKAWIVNESENQLTCVKNREAYNSGHIPLDSTEAIMLIMKCELI